jgi:hypothetical protein
VGKKKYLFYVSKVHLKMCGSMHILFSHVLSGGHTSDLSSFTLSVWEKFIKNVLGSG